MLDDNRFQIFIRHNGQEFAKGMQISSHLLNHKGAIGRLRGEFSLSTDNPETVALAAEQLFILAANLRQFVDEQIAGPASPPADPLVNAL